MNYIRKPNLQKINKAVYILTIILFNLNTTAQINKSDVIKHFILIDSTLHNKDVHLLLFKDNTFLNYGIYDNKQENDTYVWYANGHYLMENGKILLESSKNDKSQEKVIKDIKHAYKWRKDHVLIESYLEFVIEKYKEYSLVIIKNKLYDEKKKYEYIELN